VLAALGWPALALASSLQLQPVSIELSPQGVAALTIRNLDSKPAHVQARVFRWTQDGGDRLEPTQAVAVSPPIQAIPAGGEQVLRVVHVAPASDADSRQQNYRLLIDELPADPQTGGQVKVLLRYSLPLAVTPAATAPADLRFRLQHRDGQWWLRGDNRGGRRAQLSAVRVRGKKGTVDLGDGLLGYVLAGRWNQWPLDRKHAAALAGATELVASVDGQERAFPLHAPP
jgi:fimbrial chaperone protein